MIKQLVGRMGFFRFPLSTNCSTESKGKNLNAECKMTLDGFPLSMARDFILFLNSRICMTTKNLSHFSLPLISCVIVLILLQVTVNNWSVVAVYAILTLFQNCFHSYVVLNLIDFFNLEKSLWFCLSTPTEPQDLHLFERKCPCLIDRFPRKFQLETYDEK